MSRTFLWHPRAIYLTFLLGVIPYVIFAAVTRKTAKIGYSLCHHHWKRRLVQLVIAWVITILGGLTLAGDGIFPIADFSWFAVAVPLLVIGAVWLFVLQGLSAEKIEDSILYLKGTRRPFLETLPEWPEAPTKVPSSGSPPPLPPTQFVAPPRPPVPVETHAPAPAEQQPASRFDY